MSFKMIRLKHEKGVVHQRTGRFLEFSGAWKISNLNFNLWNYRAS